MEDEVIVELKRKINNLIWEYSPAQTTLEIAELRACEILNIIINVNEREEPKED